MFVDRSTPCVLYRAASSSSVERSTDARAWQRVLYAQQSTSSLEMRSLTVGNDHSIWLAEDSNGDAIVHSGDLGTTWELRDAGISGQAVTAVLAAPSDPAVVYALSTPYKGDSLLGPAEPINLFSTVDSGMHWRQVTLPAPLPPGFPGTRDSKSATDPAACSVNDVVSGGSTKCSLQTRGGGADLAASLIQVDPTDSRRLWALWPDASPPTAASAGSLPAWRLYLSQDGGSTWNPMPDDLPASWEPYQLVAIESPTHSRRLAIAVSGAPSWVEVSDDLGATWMPMALTTTAAYPGSRPVLAVSSHERDEVVIVPNDPRAFGFGGTAILGSMDGLDSAEPLPYPRSWGATVTIATGAAALVVPPVSTDNAGNFYMTINPDCSSPSNPLCPDNKTYSVLVRLTLASRSSSSSGASGQMAGASGQTSPPPTPPNRGPVSGAPGPGGSGTPTVVPRASCVVPGYPGPAAAPGQQSGSLAFDGAQLLYTNYGESGAQLDQGIIHTLVPGQGCAKGPDITVSFTLGDLDAWAQANRLPPTSHPWIDDLAYDPNRGVLWVSIGDDASIQPTPGYAGGGAWTSGLFKVSVSGGRGLARLALPTGCGQFLTYDYMRDRLWTCDGSYAVPGSSGGPPSQVAASDGTVVPSCVASIVASEGAAQGQMASWHLASPHHLYVWAEDDVNVDVYNADTCAYEHTWSHRRFLEPLGEDEQMACDATTFGSQSPVLWVRDPQAFTIFAYPIPDGDCAPMQQNTTSTTFQGTIIAPLPGGFAPPPVVGQASGSTGPAVQAPSQPVPAGQTQLQIVEQSQVQAQAQSQSQAQAQSVSQVQPGLMVQRQKRTQIATQQQGNDAQTAYQASGLRSARPSPIIAATLGLMLLGFGLAGRRPRPARHGAHAASRGDSRRWWPKTGASPTSRLRRQG